MESDVRFPESEEQKRLIRTLGVLVGKWLNAGRDSVKEGVTIQEYHQTLNELYETGWDDRLDVAYELHPELMPEKYRQKNPEFGHQEWVGSKKK